MTSELDESGRALEEALVGISEDEAAVRPDPARWSVLDCVEHLALAERGMLKRIASSPVAEPLAPDTSREVRVSTSMVNRSVLIQSPESVIPAGRYSTLAQAREEFNAARRDTLLFVHENGGNLSLRTMTHPFFGPITGFEMVLIMAGHVARHADQIREIRCGLA